MDYVCGLGRDVVGDGVRRWGLTYGQHYKVIYAIEWNTNLLPAHLLAILIQVNDCIKIAYMQFIAYLLRHYVMAVLRRPTISETAIVNVLLLSGETLLRLKKKF